MAAINPQAVELNQTIEALNNHVTAMLSQRGKSIFWPSKGILGQSADAKGKRINATIGIALEDDGSPLRLGCIEERIKLDPADVFPYAPSPGVPKLRDLWKSMIRTKNPSLGDAPISRPVVTNALTHALSICGYLFGDEGDTLFVPDMFWGNYRLIFTNAYGIELKSCNTFKAGGYDVDALRDALMSGKPGKKIVLLNFPNNPTGYTVTDSEAHALRDVLVEAADAGNDVIVLIDDAYFGLVYEEGIYRESMFSLLAAAHERLLAVKIDGATKEDYVWGFRVGFITYGIKGGSDKLYAALEAKTGGAVRGNISNSSLLSQSLMAVAYSDSSYASQKQQKFETLKRRCLKVSEILAQHSEYAEAFTALPFNSGYFMCVKLKQADPEKVRQILLSEFSTGVIAVSGVIRIAFSATPFDLLDDLFSNIYQACCKAV